MLMNLVSQNLFLPNNKYEYITVHLVLGCAAQCEVPDHFTKVGTETDNQATSITFATPFPIGVDTGGNAVRASQANVSTS